VVTVGVDIGATRVKCALVDVRAREVLQHRSIGTPVGRAAVLDAVAGLVREVGEGAVVSALGVGSCGFISHEGRVLASTETMRDWAGVDLPRELEARTSLRCVADNDGRTAAFGEALAGAARGERLVVGLTLGTGVGGGVVLDGRLVRGATGLAGAFGHVKVSTSPDVRLCACGATGCLEAYASAWALRRATGLDAREVFERAAEGDARCRAAVDEAGVSLGAGLAQIANALDPDAIVIGGGIAASFDTLWSIAAPRMAALSLAAEKATARVRRGQLGDDAGVMGAALLAAWLSSQSVV
jgi:glucokinase